LPEPAALSTLAPHALTISYPGTPTKGPAAPCFSTPLTPVQLADLNARDVLLTRTLVEAGKMMDIEALDHLVIGHGTYVSLKGRRLGF
jgi:hypothetical protein